MYLPHLYPTPKSITENKSERYVFGANEVLHINREISASVAERLKYLWNRFCCTASVLDIVVDESTDNNVIAYFGNKSELTADYYAIHVDSASVVISAINEKTFIEAFTTFVQLICPVELEVGEEQFYITAADIRDNPSIGFRSIHICIFPDSKLYTIEKAIHLAGFFKFTHVIIEFWGTLQYDVCPSLSWSGYSYTKEQIKELIKLAESYGMEVIPMFNHLGHASSSRVSIGRHTVLNNDLRMSKLFEPDGWTWCLSNKKTLKLLSDIRYELMELCGDGSYFHIGCDEAYSFASCDICREKEPYKLLSEHVNNLTEDLSKYNRRPIMWHDELINGADFKCKDYVIASTGRDNSKAIELIDKRVIIADWQYSYVSGDNPTTPYFMSKGFDTILCPFDNIGNIRSLCEDVRKLNAYGIMLTTWHMLPKCISESGLASDYVWETGEGGYAMNGVHRTELAYLLRTLYDTKGDYVSSGWCNHEVDE